MTPVELNRFFGKVIKNPSGCWLWSGHIIPAGYGQVSIGGKLFRAHRVSYKIHKGEIPAGILVCHHCDNPACVNPEHLFLGSNKDNTLDCLKKGRHPQARKTHCVNGHEFSKANTCIKKSGERRCRACHRARNKKSQNREIK